MGAEKLLSPASAAPEYDFAQPANPRILPVPLSGAGPTDRGATRPSASCSSWRGRSELYNDKAGKCQFRLKATTGQVIATGEAFETRASALKGTS
jgi:uncharacterized protein YegP (UPF0339 family)